MELYGPAPVRPSLCTARHGDSTTQEVLMEHEKDKVARDADEVVRDYYEGDETALEGEFRDMEDTASVGDERGHDRRNYTARNPTHAVSSMSRNSPSKAVS